VTGLDYLAALAALAFWLPFAAAAHRAHRRRKDRSVIWDRIRTADERLIASTPVRLVNRRRDHDPGDKDRS
jgi:hypothetical protein